MKIVVIQEAVIQPDLTPEEITAHWNKLKDVPGVTELEIKYPEGYPSAEEFHEMIGDADAVFGMWVSAMTVNEELFAKHPNLKYIATLGHGFGEFDIEMTRRKDVVITNTIYGAHTIAEFAWALLMEVCHHTTEHSQIVKGKDWTGLDHYYGRVATPQIELFEKTCGIIGLGAIGYSFAKMAQGFGMNVITYDRHKKSGTQYDEIDQVSLDELLERSDVISLNAPYSASSAKMINEETIGKMKDGVILINTARGGIIDEPALAKALKSGKIYGAGLDVLTNEPPEKDNPVVKCDNAITTAHIAWLTRESRLRACDIAIENFKAYLKGAPVSVIN